MPSVCCLAFLGLDEAPLWVFAVAAVSGLIGALFVFRYAILVGFPLWVLRHLLYRTKVHGQKHVPLVGPVLFVSNHVTRLDALLILASHRRRICLLVWRSGRQSFFARWLFRLTRTISIDGASGPRAVVRALREARAALQSGDAVCMFAEDGLVRSDFQLRFEQALKRILKRSGVPILPVCLDHVWGSIFGSERAGLIWKKPVGVSYRVHVNFGKPIDTATEPGGTAFVVRQAIQKLFADSAIRRAGQRRAVHRQFVRMACRHPFRTCLIDENSPKPVLKYGEALVGAKLVAKRLRRILGDVPTVGVWLPSSAGAAIANISLAFLGKTVVNLNFTSAPETVRSAIRQCGITKVLTVRRFLQKVNLDLDASTEFVYLEDFRKDITRWERIRTMLGVLLLPGIVHERWLLGLGKHRPDDLATIIFSSGSTGEPKGVMLTHANIAANAESVIQAIDPAPADRVLGILPFFHSFGYTVTLWLPLQIGASVVYHANPLQAREIGELCSKYRATIFLSTPTFLRSYIKRCEPADFASLRILVCGAEKLPQPLAREFKEKFGIAPLEGYGCTELAPVAAVNLPDWCSGDQLQKGTKPGTIGRPVPGVAVRVVGRDTGKPVPPGLEGLLQCFGANVMKGYLDREDLTRMKIVDGGWYVTGDLAMLDEEGFITITGREERFAKVAGEMVPLERVEEELHALLDGNERVVAITAIPDAKRGERIVVLHLPLSVGPGELCRKLSERGLPNLYLPSPRDFFQVGELPILGSGKLDLKKCKQKALELAE